MLVDNHAHLFTNISFIYLCSDSHEVDADDDEPDGELWETPIIFGINHPWESFSQNRQPLYHVELVFHMILLFHFWWDNCGLLVSHILIKNLKIMPFFRMFLVILLLKIEFISKKFENLGKLVANGTTPGTYVKLKVVDFSTNSSFTVVLQVLSESKLVSTTHFISYFLSGEQYLKKLTHHQNAQT